MKCNKITNVIKFIIITTFIITGISLNKIAYADTAMKPAYDLSQWQKALTLSQVQQLKNETSFLILRAQYGSSYQDQVINNNIKLVEQVGIPYGVYSYSMYTSANDAITEAKSLYKIAPNANFYVNDMEENNVTSGTLTQATQQWATTMKSLTNKPTVLYSGLYFMNNKLQDAKSTYDALWIASYGSGEPNPSYNYDLWQYTDKAKSAALNQSVDASIIPNGGKPLSFWTSGTHTINTNNSNTNSSNSITTQSSSSSSSSSTSPSSSSSVSSSSSASSSSSSQSANKIAIAKPTTTTSNTDKTYSTSKSVATNKAKKAQLAKEKAKKEKLAKAKAEKAKKAKLAKEKAERIKKEKLAKEKAKKARLAKEKAKKAKQNKKTINKNKINAKYYSQLQTYKIQVTNKNGIYIYNANGQKVKKLKYGQQLAVKYIEYVNGISQITLANGNHITGYKSAVKFI